ncbi:MAG: HAMP domain-containing histidine kinase [Treponema sp.]|nr:HAMP domain-containing histidine kinase [Treponema sp.]
MTIKRQFCILAGLIIAIPILGALYISIHQYIHSPSRLFLKGIKDIEQLNKFDYSPNNRKELADLLRTIPPHVDYCLIDENYNILISKMREFSSYSTIPPQEFWKKIKTTPKNYFYQITYSTIDGKLVYLIARIKNHPEKRGPLPFIPILIALLTVIVIFCIAVLILIFFNISKSITELENKTHAIAAGKLTEKINLKEGSSNEITSITESLEKMRLSLLEAQNQKNKFIMGISHDLRTPVAIIKGYTEAISDGVISEKNEVNNALELIKAKTTQLESMIDTLINYMKMNSADLREKLLPESITNLIIDFAKEAKITANVFKRNIITSIDLKKDIKIPLNHQLVTRAFENLFNNALRYTKDNDTITISAFQKNNTIFFSIEDTGCGIEEADLKNIFNLFYRGTNSRREEGMGIGLSVVKNIIETHGWDISVKSKKDIGSCFSISIPINKN